MDQDYLIPANTKNSRLLFGLFNTVDAIILGSGILVTMLLWITMPVNKMAWAIISIAPVAITGFLVVPVPNYHNVRTVLKNAFIFYRDTLQGTNKLKWRGWCYEDGKRNKK